MLVERGTVYTTRCIVAGRFSHYRKRSRCVPPYGVDSVPKSKAIGFSPSSNDTRLTAANRAERYRTKRACIPVGKPSLELASVFVRPSPAFPKENLRMGMAARKHPEPAVYPCSYLIDGRPAYFVIGWDGSRSEDHVVGEFETEREVIDYLADALWTVRPRELRGKGPAQVARPGLRLVP